MFNGLHRITDGRDWVKDFEQIGAKMNVELLNITGVAEAILAMFQSKKHCTSELVKEVSMEVMNFYFNFDTELSGYLEKLRKYGIEHEHTVLLKFIDVSFMVTGIHRAAQDDFDSHAQRLENRIVRGSTRLAKFDKDECKSEYYADKIMLPCELPAWRELPDEMGVDGVKYVKGTFGYIREDCVKDQDVVRGTYPLSIQSNFITKCNIHALRHIYKLRGPGSHAHPELQNMMTQLFDSIEKQFGVIYQCLLADLRNV